MEVSKVVKVKLEGMNLSVIVDSDVDGEPSISLAVKLPEVASEIFALISGAKKPA
jgi:hypothetical protein